MGDFQLQRGWLLKFVKRRYQDCPQCQNPELMLHHLNHLTINSLILSMYETILLRAVPVWTTSHQGHFKKTWNKITEYIKFLVGLFRFRCVGENLCWWYHKPICLNALCPLFYFNKSTVSRNKNSFKMIQFNARFISGILFQINYFVPSTPKMLYILY